MAIEQNGREALLEAGDFTIIDPLLPLCRRLSERIKYAASQSPPTYIDGVSRQENSRNRRTFKQKFARSKRRGVHAPDYAELVQKQNLQTPQISYTKRLS